jgi:hypothetical protein
MKAILILCILNSFNVYSNATLSVKWTRKLFKSIDQKNLKLAAKSIKKGADVNAYNYIYNGRVSHNPVLIYALKKNQVEIAKLIVDAGANINLTRKIDRANALIVASRRGQLSFIKHIKGHADLNINYQKGNGRTALFSAIWRQNIKVIKYLLTFKNLNLNLTTTFINRSVLEQAVFQRSKLITLLLLTHNQNITPFNEYNIDRTLKFCEQNELFELYDLVKMYNVK